MRCDLGGNITFGGKEGRFRLSKKLSHDVFSIKVAAKPVERF